MSEKDQPNTIDTPYRGEVPAAKKSESSEFLEPTEISEEDLPNCVQHILDRRYGVGSGGVMHSRREIKKCEKQYLEKSGSIVYFVYIYYVENWYNKFGGDDIKNKINF